MQKSSSILILFYLCAFSGQALDFGHVDKFLWWKNKDPPKWWPFKGSDNSTDSSGNDDGTNTNNGNVDEVVDPEDTELDVQCFTCINRMRTQRKFKWERITEDDWVDESFPPNEWAMYFNDPYSDDMMTSTMRDTFEFRRVVEGDEIPDAALWFNGDPEDYYLQADQLYLGDCYFIESMSAAAYIQHPFETDTFLTDGLEGSIHAATVFVKGIPQTIVVDNFLPFNVSNNNWQYLAFATQDETGAVWNSVLEKMWAKTNCNYELITSGSPVEVYDWLLGVPVEQLWMDDDFDNDPDALWTSITAHLDAGYILGVGNQAGSDTYGLVSSHSWSVLNYATVTDATYCSGQDCRILLIRNPWGIDSDYQARWNDDDTDRWIQDNIDQVEDYVGAADDGVYWMQIEDFIDGFIAYQVGYYNPGWFHAHYEEKRANDEDTFTYCIKHKGGSDAEAYIWINYYNDRMYPTSCYDSSDYVYGYMTLLDDSGAIVGEQSVTWDSIQNEKFYYISDLAPGNYFLKVSYSEWPEGTAPEFTVQVYSDSDEFKIRKASQAQIDALEEASNSNIMDEGIDGVDDPQTSVGDYLTSSYGFNSGYAYVMIEPSQTCATLNIVVTLNGVETQLSWENTSADCTQESATVWECPCNLSSTGEDYCAFSYEGNSIDWTASISFSC